MKRLFGLVVLTVALLAHPAHAYIGPGAGFAFAGSFLALIAAFLLAIGTILLWPLTFVWRTIRVGNPFKNAAARRIIVLGLDGMDPGLATKFMQEGKLPNFRKLAEQGVFRTLDTSNPSMSPVAWSTFATGVDASGHGIFDFLTRDPCTYAPLLSSTDIGQATRVVNIGKYIIPLGSPKITLLQRGQAFWKVLGEKHIFSIIQRVPITFPPVKFRGLLLSGMCVPDLRGSQGTFAFFSTQTDAGVPAFTGGEQTVLRRQGNRIRSRIVGPDNGMVRGNPRMILPLTLTIADDKQSVKMEIDGVAEPITLRFETYSPWVTLTFPAAPTVKVSGIARFYLTSIDPEVSLYMTPIHIDPENPAMPISHPSVYAVYLAKKFGSFATLGLAEDTWALNERVIDEKAFYQAAMDICEEREQMFFDAVSRVKTGLVTTVFDTTDRIQHMFYRYLDPTHPANEGKPTGGEYANAIERAYIHMDGVLGKLMTQVGDDENTVVMVISDHGFTNFRRGVNLNSWLRENGYLTLLPGSDTSGDWFEKVDWSKTQAFSLGLTGLFINRKGREQSGIVTEGDEYKRLTHEIARKLEALVDPQTGGRAIRRVEIAPEYFDGPARFDAPDLLVGYEGGYRNSWDCATGSVTRAIFSDNTKSWSGDHCVDPAIVPGVFFCNRAIVTPQPRLIDIPYSILALFGHKPPDYMQGKMIFVGKAGSATTRGLLDPASLPQSGAAPGALVSSTPAWSVDHVTG
ncbi:MAG: nucleotide pyrophosphatase [Myxococcales bacterium]|nr:nucleotide pyrophosphatase [Myxococcales bacterium]